MVTSSIHHSKTIKYVVCLSVVCVCTYVCACVSMYMRACVRVVCVHACVCPIRVVQKYFFNCIYFTSVLCRISDPSPPGYWVSVVSCFKLSIFVSVGDNLVTVYELDPLNRHLSPLGSYASPSTYISSSSSTIVQIVLIAETPRWV